MGMRSFVDLAFGGRDFRDLGGQNRCFAPLPSNTIDKGQLSIVRGDGEHASL